MFKSSMLALAVYLFVAVSQTWAISRRDSFVGQDKLVRVEAVMKSLLPFDEIYMEQFSQWRLKQVPKLRPIDWGEKMANQVKVEKNRIYRGMEILRLLFCT